ncbi:MAG: B12-binding domain-containing radical SAM protein [Proteobacteria bacterium]|nr:B12-binding domain-containing radical SAM protein [Pseudomonadota bacterium]
MKIKLISAAIRSRSKWSQIMTLSLPAVAAATPEGHEITIEDERVKKIRLDDSPDLVGISFEVFRAYRAYEIADYYRQRHVPVVLGGMHASVMPEEGLLHADAVVVGEAEEVWPQVIADAVDGKMQGIYRGQKTVDLSKLNRPRLDLLDASRYFPLYPIEATRGCTHACSFCSTRYVHGYGFRTRPVDHVIGDVRRAGNNIIAFLDDNLAADEVFAKQLFTAMIPHEKKYFMQSHVLLAENEELLSLAAKAGCIGAFVGIESVSADTLSEANKGFNRVDRLKDNIARFHDRGILVDGGIIFGFDTDTPDVFDRTIDVLEKIKIDSVAVNILIPYPGTEFYRKFEKAGRIICTDYTKYTGNTVIIKPKNMTAEQLQAGYNRFTRDYYKMMEIVYRVFKQPNAVAAITRLIANVTHRINCSPEK